MSVEPAAADWMRAAAVCFIRAIALLATKAPPSLMPSRRQDCYSAAPPSAFSRRFNRHVILLHPNLPVAHAPTVMERERSQNDSPANG